MERLKKIVPRILFSLVLFWILLEMGLVLFANQLPLSIANAVFSEYRMRGGIYYRDRDTGVILMRPNQTCTNFFNGYWWEHETDEYGFRNPPGTEKDVLLLGDSMIYGHGTEYKDNVASILTHDYGWKAYNMGQQGTTIDSQYTLLRLHIDEFKPSKVYVFPLVNDFSDLWLTNTPEKLADPPVLKFNYETLKEQVYNQPVNFKELKHRNHIYRLHEKLKHSGLERPFSTDWVDCLMEKDKYDQIGAAYRRLLLETRDLCREHGAELHVVFIYTHAEGKVWEDTQDKFRQYLDEVCRELEIPYGDTQPILYGHPEYFLPDDFHLTPAGHRRLAKFIAEQK